MNRVTLPPGAEVSLSVRSGMVADVQRHKAQGQPDTLTWVLMKVQVSNMNLHHAGDLDAVVRVTVPEEEQIEHLRALGYHIAKKSDSDLISGEELARAPLGVPGKKELGKVARSILLSDDAAASIFEPVFADRDLGDEDFDPCEMELGRVR